MPPTTDAPHVVVVGGGITGLAAATAVHDARPDWRVTVLEASGRTGGKLGLAEVAGIPVDTGAEALLARRPEALDLARRAGLAADVVLPATTAAAVWSRGDLRPLPRSTLLGVPTRLSTTTAVLGPLEQVRAALDVLRPAPSGHLLAPGEDTAIGELVARRMGAAVLDRLVEPLLGGVYAGHARQLSLAMTNPALHAAATREPTLTAAARRAAAPPSGTDGAGPRPVFAGISGGVGRLPAALSDALLATGSVTVRTRTTVRALERTPTGWRLLCGPVPETEALDADAVVLAVPAAPAARLLGAHVPSAAAELAGLHCASVAIVTLALPIDRLSRPLRGSGVLVPPVEHRVVKAVTYSSSKWSWHGRAAAADGLAVLRASVGRAGEAAVLQRDDAEVVDVVRDDLADLLGITAPPAAALVSRWGGALPQYRPSHRDLVDRVRRAVAALPALTVAGVAYDGVGVPACIASGTRAAETIITASPRAAETIITASPRGHPGGRMAP